MNSRTESDKTRRGLILAVVLILALLPGCSLVKQDRQSLNRFAGSYIELRKALSDATINSWAIALDAAGSESERVTYYRSSFQKALHIEASNRARAEAATEALGYFETQSTKMLHDFETRNETLDGKSLAFVEAANGLRDETSRKVAVQISNTARKAQQTLEELEPTYRDTYDLQLKLMKAIVGEKGDLRHLSKEFKETAVEQNKLYTKADKMRQEVEKSERAIKEQYAQFKGITGIELDFVEP